LLQTVFIDHHLIMQLSLIIAVIKQCLLSKSI